MDVDLGLAARQPPDLLYHGTADRFVASIRQKGLVPGARRHVHLSADTATAETVGARHGHPVVLVVEAQQMHESGREFLLSRNGVWLTGHVPPHFLRP